MSKVLTVREVLDFIEAEPGCRLDELTQRLSMDFYQYFVKLVVDHLVDAGIVEINANGKLFGVVRPVKRQRQSKVLMHNGPYPPALINYHLERIQLITTETPTGAGYLLRIFDVEVHVMRIGLGSELSTVHIPLQNHSIVLAIDESPPAGGFHWQRNDAHNIYLYLRVPDNRFVVATYTPNKQQARLLWIGYD